MVMGSSVSLAQLPHVYPFRLLDRALMVEPGQWVVALKQVTHADRLAGPHGLMTPVLLAEMMAQASGLALGGGSAGAATPVVLAGVGRFRCPPQARVAVSAGDQLLITVRVVRRFGSAVKTHASVRAGARRCAAAELVLQVRSAP
jgi:3-hydroxymyristoyl/3-hydroxydecanoyl-(acyl carrier protein) dehydratase